MKVTAIHEIASVVGHAPQALVIALEMYDTPLDMRETTSIHGVDPTPLTARVRQRIAGAAAN
jgi:hypothetical protein